MRKSEVGKVLILKVWLCRCYLLLLPSINIYARLYMRMRGFILTILFLLPFASGWQTLSAQESTDGGGRLEASLVTCAPGTEAYELYGHTALRIRSLDGENEDFVFNYGVFSFAEDNFIWRWTLGETDYSVEVLPYDIFCRWYEERGRAVNEQPLNLRQDELQRLAAAAMTDVKAAHENGWTYRYNFFYDNCTTRVIDLIESCLAPGSRIEWPQAEKQTLREMLHQFVTPVHPWLSEGQDLLIGLEVDKPAPMRSQLFSPIWASHYAAKAKVVRPDGSREVLVGGKEAPMEPAVAENIGVKPWMVYTLVLLLCLGWTIYARRKHREARMWRIAAAVHIVQGLVGILVAILFFWSTHPAVDSNWLIALFNPLWLAMAWLLWRSYKTKKEGYDVLYLGVFLSAGIAYLTGGIKGQCYPDVARAVIFVLLFLLCRTDEKK